MARYDRISTLFFIGIAFAISVESIRLGPGSLSNPGPGLVPLGCGLALGILASVFFALTFKNSLQTRGAFWKSELKMEKILTLVSLIGYISLIDFLGFPLVTFLLMGFMCRWIGKMGWKATIFTSVVTTVSSYLLFVRCLAINFPHGVFGF